MFLLLCLCMQQTYFLMKNRIVLFITGCFALLLSSCLGSDDYDYELSYDCQIISFSLSNDSIPGLSDVVFTIDQVNGLIFNADSMPFGTVLDEKVVCTVKLASTVFSCQVIQEALGTDTISWNLQDSLDFSKPVKFINTLWNGETKKVYTAQVNIHQVVPDSMVWSLYAENIGGEAVKNEKVVVWETAGTEYYYMYQEPANGGAYKLYRSPVSDGKNWSIQTTAGLPAGEAVLSQLTVYEDGMYVATSSGVLYQSKDGQNWTKVISAPSVKSILGALVIRDDYTINGRQTSALSVVIDQNGVLTFASMDKDQVWTAGQTVYDGFPVSGFGNVSYNSMFRARLMVVAGRDKNNSLQNTTWSTDDGRNWALLTGFEANPFDKQEGVAVTEYDDQFFLISGINESGKASSSIYLSQDGGISWNLSDTLVVMPSTFKPRGFASIHVDEQQYMNLFGGKEQVGSNDLNQIWRGRINRLGF